jgi:hypothetical protein
MSLETNGIMKKLNSHVMITTNLVALLAMLNARFKEELLSLLRLK